MIQLRGYNDTIKFMKKPQKKAVNEAGYKKASILFYEQNNISYFKQVFMEQFEFVVKNHFI
jgi:hypothetical protein